MFSPKQFIERVETLVAHDNLTYVESVITIAKEKEVDPEDLAELITGQLKDKMRIEANRNHCFKIKEETPPALPGL